MLRKLKTDQINKTNPHQHLKNTGERFINLIATTLTKTTVINYRTKILKFICFLNNHYPQVTSFSQLSRSPHMEHWLTHLAETYSKEDTRRAYIISIKRFLSDIYEWEWEKPPKDKLLDSRDVPSIPKYLPRPITPDADRKLKETLRKKGDMLSLAILLLRNTGMRIGELRDLEVDSLKKLPDGQYLLHVPLGKLKTERLIPVDKETPAIFNRILDMRALLLPLPNQRTGKPTQFLLVRKNWSRPTYSGLRAAFRKAVLDSDIRINVSPHQLRHTFATELLRGGINLPSLMKLLGHKSISMTVRYTGVSHPDLHRAYFAALHKSRALNLIPKPPVIPQKEDQANEPDYIFNGINNLITKIGSAGRDLKDKKSRKKLQRISERLRRMCKDIDKVIK